VGELHFAGIESKVCWGWSTDSFSTLVHGESCLSVWSKTLFLLRSTCK